MRNIIITLSGFKGSGKDTVAKKLKEILELNEKNNVMIFSFANSVRKINEILFNIKSELVSDKELPIQKLRSITKKDMSYRDINIYTAENFKKLYGDNIWAKILVRQIRNNKKIFETVENNTKENNIFIISDLRFICEFVAIHHLIKDNYEVYNWFVMNNNAYPDWVKYGYDANRKSDIDVIKNDFNVNRSEYEWTTFKNVNWKNVIPNHDTLEELDNSIKETVIASLNL